MQRSQVRGTNSDSGCHHLDSLCMIESPSSHLNVIHFGLSEHPGACPFYCCYFEVHPGHFTLRDVHVSISFRGRWDYPRLNVVIIVVALPRLDGNGVLPLSLGPHSKSAPLCRSVDDILRVAHILHTSIEVGRYQLWWPDLVSWHHSPTRSVTSPVAPRAIKARLLGQSTTPQFGCGPTVNLSVFPRAWDCLHSILETTPCEC